MREFMKTRRHGIERQGDWDYEDKETGRQGDTETGIIKI
jgi:hypothetical protein